MTDLPQSSSLKGASGRSRSGRDRIGRHLAVVFALAVILYLASFYAVEHLRTRKGPWQVTFQSDDRARPSLLVSQPQLRLTNVTFTFPGQQLSRSNQATTLIFDRPKTNVPFGRVVYFDTTFLPGSLVFNVFDHEIQLLPRVLLVDNHEIPWQSGSMHTLPSVNTNR